MAEIKSFIYRSKNGKLDVQASIEKDELFSEALLNIKNTVEEESKKLEDEPTEPLEVILERAKKEVREETFQEIYTKLGIVVPKKEQVDITSNTEDVMITESQTNNDKVSVVDSEGNIIGEQG